MVKADPTRADCRVSLNGAISAHNKVVVNRTATCDNHARFAGRENAKPARWRALHLQDVGHQFIGSAARLPPVTGGLDGAQFMPSMITRPQLQSPMATSGQPSPVMSAAATPWR